MPLPNLLITIYREFTFQKISEKLFLLFLLRSYERFEREVVRTNVRSNLLEFCYYLVYYNGGENDFAFLVDYVCGRNPTNVIVSFHARISHRDLAEIVLPNEGTILDAFLPCAFLIVKGIAYDLYAVGSGIGSVYASEMFQFLAAVATPRSPEVKYEILAFVLFKEIHLSAVLVDNNLWSCGSRLEEVNTVFRIKILRVDRNEREYQ